MNESAPAARRAVRVGLLSNPRSGANRRRPGAVERVLRDYPQTLHRQASDPEQVQAALVELAAQAPEVLAVNGGDGTVQATLTTLLGDETLGWKPRLALLRGGTTNMTAADLGLRGRADRALRRLLDWARHGGEEGRVERPVLAVRAGPRAACRCGLFFGAGAIVRGIEHFHRTVNSKGLGGELGPGVSMLRVALALVRREASYVAPVAMSFHLEPPVPVGGPGAGDYLVVLASSLERLFLGLHPYWGACDGAFHFTSLRAQPVRPFSTLPRLLLGKPPSAATAANGYFSRRVDELRIEMDGDFTLDGEIYGASRSQGPLSIRSAGTVSFVQV